MTRAHEITTRRLMLSGTLALLLGLALPAWARHAKTKPVSVHAEADRSAELAEQSRDAGLLTDWHLVGHFGQSAADFNRSFAPERQALREAASEAARKGAQSATAAALNELPGREFPAQNFELIFPVGKFALPKALKGQKGVFYALSYVYLSDSGEWNIYLESPGEASVFVDGRPVLTRDGDQTGAQRETIHAGSGYHMVLVKFTAQAAPFQVAILPPNSGSRRKNSIPNLGGAEDLNAMLDRSGLRAARSS